ncbi:DUF637 domain-containing protein [Pseudomonas sp. Eth.TT006]
MSSKGRGNTDETLRQTQMIAKGNIVIKAVDGLKIDIKDVNQQSVSQTIDAMVKADPQLAWLKDAESRGDVDWRRVKEIHESFKYENSGVGPAAQIAIAIMMSFVMGPGGLALTSGGFGGAIATSLATTAVTSTISNKGNLGAALKDTFSADSLKSAAIAGFTAGVLNYADANWFAGGTSKTANILTSSNFTDVAIRTTGRAIITSGISTAIGGGSLGDSFGAALVGQAGSVAMATGFNWVGDTIKFPDGSLEKTVAHALMGGLLSQAMGGDFATGAAAAGLNEAAMNVLADFVGTNKDLHQMLSQLTGMIGAAAVGGDLQLGAGIAGNATTYNHDFHMPPGLTEYANASTTLTEYMQSIGASAEDVARVQRALGEGQGFEGVQPATEFVKAWGQFMAGELSFLGLAAVIGRVSSGFAKSVIGVEKIEPPIPKFDVTDAFERLPTSNGVSTWKYGNPDGVAGLVVRVNDEGVLAFEIRAAKDHPYFEASGTDMFASAMQRLGNEGVQVNKIRGSWETGTDSVNIAQCRQNIANGMSQENAALNTWTGKLSQKYGFTKVEKIEDDGYTTYVTFGK